MKSGKMLLELLLGGGFALIALAAIAAQVSQTRQAQVGLRAMAVAGFEADRARAQLRSGAEPSLRPPWRVEVSRAARGGLVEVKLKVQRADSAHSVERRALVPGGTL